MLTSIFDFNRDNYAGSINAPIELVQYSDYQCAHCLDVLAVIEHLQSAMGKHIRFVFRNFPHPNINPLCLDMAVAAEAADLQGKFWEMHNLIYRNQNYLNRSSVNWFAEEIGLNMNQFTQKRESRKLFTKISDDFESGIRSGVNGTPTFFINRLRYNGFNDFRGLLKSCSYLMNYDLLTV